MASTLSLAILDAILLRSRRCPLARFDHVLWRKRDVGSGCVPWDNCPDGAAAASADLGDTTDPEGVSRATSLKYTQRSTLRAYQSRTAEPSHDHLWQSPNPQRGQRGSRTISIKLRAIRAASSSHPVKAEQY